MNMESVVKDTAASGNRIRGVQLAFAAPALIEVLATVDVQSVHIDGALDADRDAADIRAPEMARAARMTRRAAPSLFACEACPARS